MSDCPQKPAPLVLTLPDLAGLVQVAEAYRLRQRLAPPPDDARQQQTPAEPAGP